MTRVQGTSPGRTNADMVWVSVKTAKICTVLTRRVTVLGMHTWHLPMLMVVRVQFQTRRLPTCLRRNSIISTQDATRNASTSSKRGLLTCVDTIWPGVHAETNGMSLHNARAIKSLELTVMSVKAVMKMCFLQSLVVFAPILPNHWTIPFGQLYCFCDSIEMNFVLFRPILCVFCIWLSYESRVSFF